VSQQQEVGPTEQEVGPTASLTNRFLLWPLMIGILVPLVVGCAVAFAWPLTVFVVLIWALIWGLSGLGALIALVIYARRGAWRAVASLAFLPAMMLSSILFPRTILTPLLSVGDFLHFWADRSSYLAEVAALPRDRGPRFARFPLGGFMLGPTEEIVYDESDEVALPPDQQTDVWRERVGERSDLVTCRYAHLHLGEHFYKVIISC